MKLLAATAAVVLATALLVRGAVALADLYDADYRLT